MKSIAFLSIFVFTFFAFKGSSAIAMTPKDLLSLQYVSGAALSPDGNYIAYTRHVPRKATEKPGVAYNELYVYDIKNNKHKPFIIGKVMISSVSWKPDGSVITFKTRRRNNKKTQVWAIPLDGGEAYQLTFSPNGIIAYQWNPDGKTLAYSAKEPSTKREKALREKGYGFIFYEENLKPINLYVYNAETKKTKKLTDKITVWSFNYSQDGKTIALAASDKNLVDYRYMFQEIYLLNPETKALKKISANEGKLGNYKISPDGRHIAYSAARERKDHAVSQVFVMDMDGSNIINLTPPQFKGHITWVNWKNNYTLIYKADEGVNVNLYTVKINGDKRKLLLSGQKEGIVFSAPNYTKNFDRFVFLGQSPQHPYELYSWKPSKHVKRLTDSNPWLNNVELGEQRSFTYKAEDGLVIEGLLIYPVGYKKGEKYPLLVFVHGGPESHYTNGWLTRYSTPGQIMASKGYVVFYPNYRASTGYGVDFALKAYGDPAGKEFSDIKDGINYLIKEGIADATRVGLGGGSYGGYAAAWFATYYTDLVKATCMFVGISDLISKKGTTDIPYEELYVHAGKKLEESWRQSLERSPIYYAHQSKTAILIFGGAADTRVHPSQSMELYRRLKFNGHPAVRLVQYPGEGHGNRMQPGRIDVLYRTIAWYDWYVESAKPLDGNLPPLDISDKYGLNLPQN